MSAFRQTVERNQTSCESDWWKPVVRDSSKTKAGKCPLSTVSVDQGSTLHCHQHYSNCLKTATGDMARSNGCSSRSSSASSCARSWRQDLKTQHHVIPSLTLCLTLKTGLEDAASRDSLLHVMLDLEDRTWRQVQHHVITFPLTRYAWQMFREFLEPSSRCFWPLGARQSPVQNTKLSTFSLFRTIAILAFSLFKKINNIYQKEIWILIYFKYT